MLQGALMIPRLPSYASDPSTPGEQGDSHLPRVPRAPICSLRGLPLPQVAGAPNNQGELGLRTALGSFSGAYTCASLSESPA